MELKLDEIVALLTFNYARQEEVAALERRVAWFERQLFGQKSERRILDVPAAQLSLGEVLGATPENPLVTIKHIAENERMQRTIAGTSMALTDVAVLQFCCSSLFAGKPS